MVSSLFHGQGDGGKLAVRGMAKRLYVVAGELSGDAHGAGLLRALKPMVPALEIHGAGGPEMAAVAGPGLVRLGGGRRGDGVWEVLKRYGWFKERFHRMLGELKEFRPDVLLLIDYPGFNLRFAEAVKRECPETRIVYYVSPQVWAWNKGRIPKMVRLLDEMLCLFPFEQPIFQSAGLKTTFAGHPLVDELEEKRIPGVVRDESLVGLFPGSREREVARLFPMMIDTAKRLKAWRARPDLRSARRLRETGGADPRADGGGGRGGSHHGDHRRQPFADAAGVLCGDREWHRHPWRPLISACPIAWSIGWRR